LTLQKELSLPRLARRYRICAVGEDDDELMQATEPKRRHQIRRRALAQEMRADFDRRLTAGEDVLSLARAFGIEPWYAQRRAKRVLSRVSKASEVSPFIATFPDMEEEMTPMQYACCVLGGRVRPLRNGYYVLDGFEAGPKEVTRAANRLLRDRGHAEIPYPGLTPLYR
jgi:hypothetical protein